MKEIYQVLSAALGQEQRIAQSANNLANVNTTGFKKDGSVFVDLLKSTMLEKQGTAGAPATAEAANPAGAVWPGLPRSYTDFSSGPIRETGRALDVAIEGEGFFKVEGAAGETLYSRAGDFTLNADMELVTPDGRRVLDAGGSPIVCNSAQGTLSISGDGRVRAGTNEVGRIGLVRFAEPGTLVKRGDGTYAAPAGVEGEVFDAATLRPAALEGSNINPVTEMIGMIQLQRAYESHQKVVRTIDEATQRRIEAASN